MEEKKFRKLFLLRIYEGQSLEHTTLYDEYIDRPKLTKQKNPFECQHTLVVPPLLKCVGTEYLNNFHTATAHCKVI